MRFIWSPGGAQLLVNRRLLMNPQSPGAAGGPAHTARAHLLVKLTLGLWEAGPRAERAGPAGLRDLRFLSPDPAAVGLGRVTSF